jgi:hypothetical protein
LTFVTFLVSFPLTQVIVVALAASLGVALGVGVGAAAFARYCWPAILSAAKFFALASAVYLEIQVDSP